MPVRQLITFNCPVCGEECFWCLTRDTGDVWIEEWGCYNCHANNDPFYWEVVVEKPRVIEERISN